MQRAFGQKYYYGWIVVWMVFVALLVSAGAS